MATSGTYNFTLSIADVIDEACERAGIAVGHAVMRNSASVKRSLNLITIEWENQGIRQWLMEPWSLPLTIGDPHPVLPIQTIDILDMVLRRNGVDFPVGSMSRSDYLMVPTKTTPGMPNTYWVDRQRDRPLLTLWPVPDKAGDVLYFNQFRHIQDFTAGLPTSNTDIPDIPYLALEALTAALAARIARKRPDEMVGEEGKKYPKFDPARARELEALAEKALKQFKWENRERSDLTLYGHYGRR